MKTLYILVHIIVAAGLFCSVLTAPIPKGDGGVEVISEGRKAGEVDSDAYVASVEALRSNTSTVRAFTGAGDASILDDMATDVGVKGSSSSSVSEASPSDEAGDGGVKPSSSFGEPSSTPAPRSTSAIATPVIPDLTSPVVTPSASPNRDTPPPFVLTNGRAAQTRNTLFATLNFNSSCITGENACIGTSRAQCIDGNFVVLTDCGAANGLTCAALPLANSPGTFVQCVMPSAALEKIVATGATGGFTGSS